MSEQINNYLSQNDIKGNISKDSRHNAFYVRINRQNDLIKLYDIFYRDKNWFLKRKYMKFDDIV